VSTVGFSCVRSRQKRSIGADSRTRWHAPMAVCLIGLTSLSVALSGCAGSTTTPTLRATSPSVSIPRGWSTYTYGSVAISVPSDWVVRHDTNCPNSRAPGTLLLGFPAVPEQCTLIPASTSYVGVTTLPVGNVYRPLPLSPTPIVVNGIRIYQGSGSPTSLVWVAPALGVQVAGTGPETPAILQTFRRA